MDHDGDICRVFPPLPPCQVLQALALIVHFNSFNPMYIGNRGFSMLEHIIFPLYILYVNTIGSIHSAQCV